MHKAFKYRIYPSHAQVTTLECWLAQCCELYNAALQERRDAWKICKKSVTYKEQQNQLPEIKECRTEFGMLHSQVLQDTLKRLDKAFAAFFRRVKKGDKAGFPRFRSRSRYRWFTFRQSGYVMINFKLS